MFSLESWYHRNVVKFTQDWDLGAWIWMVNTPFFDFTSDMGVVTSEPRRTGEECGWKSGSLLAELWQCRGHHMFSHILFRFVLQKPSCFPPQTRYMPCERAMSTTCMFEVTGRGWPKENHPFFCFNGIWGVKLWNYHERKNHSITSYIGYHPGTIRVGCHDHQWSQAEFFCRPSTGSMQDHF